MTACDITTQDLLSPNKFRIVIERFPSVEFFTQRLPIPSWTLGTTRQATNRDVDIDLPGDKLEYEDLILSVLINEDLAPFRELHNWAKDVLKYGYKNESLSDISIILQTSNRNYNTRLVFYNCFPYNASTILLDATQPEDQPISTDMLFKYTHYEFK